LTTLNQIKEILEQILSGKKIMPIEAVDVGEIVCLVMISIGVIIFIVSMILQKSLIKYFPGILCLWFVFLFTNFESVVETNLAEIFNLFEHIFILLSAICFILGILYEYYSKYVRVT